MTDTQKERVIREHFARLGAKGGRSGSRADKVRAARLRWGKTTAPKKVSK